MRKDLASLMRRLASRPLGCEPLEQRALLTSLIAAVEIPPIPVSEFTQQARSFVESALEQVTVMQRQAPIKATVDSQTQLFDDGRTVRITNYTVELDQPIDQAPSHQSTKGQHNDVRDSRVTVSAGSTPNTSADRQTSSATRSNLVFSFMIFPDNSVSIRARLSNPVQWAGLAVGQTKDFGQPTNRLFHSIIEPSWRMSSWLANQSAPALSLDSADSTGNSNAQQQPVWTTRQAVADKAQIGSDRGEQAGESHVELAVDAIEGSGLIQQWVEIVVDDDASQARKLEHAISQTQIDFSSSSSAELSKSDWTRDQQGEVADMPVPSGMVQLEIMQLVNEHFHARDVSAHASAIHQVFVHASDENPSQFVLANGHSSPRAEQKHAAKTDQFDSTRWESSTLVISVLTGGLILARRPTRRAQAVFDNQVARASTVPG